MKKMFKKDSKVVQILHSPDMSKKQQKEFNAGFAAYMAKHLAKVAK
jgi:hypothetical protein